MKCAKCSAKLSPDEMFCGDRTQYLGHLIGPANKHGIVLDNFI